MRVTIDLSSEEVAEIRRFTEIVSEDDAVTKAVREFLRFSTLRELTGASGKFDYTDTGESMEALEGEKADPSDQ
jgi:Arc/MetJ family transcription regulator